MCRLSGVTFNTEAVGIDTGVLLHEMMFRAAVEELGQKDGWGVADARNQWRSLHWYVEDVPMYLPDLDRTDMLIGHVRKRSTGTGSTVNENHPYAWQIGDELLTAAHNGWIDGTNWKEWSQGHPQTDSWRALNDLAVILAAENSPDISADIVNRWLSEYHTGSHYAFLIKWKGRMHAIRGKTRTLNVLRVTDAGWLINTSGNVLRLMKRYLKEVEDIESENVLYIKDNNMLTFGLNEPEYVWHELDPKHKERVYPATQSAWSGNTWRDNNSKNETTTVAGNARNDDGDKDTQIITAPSVTSPRKGRGTVVNQLPLVLGNESNIIGGPEDAKKWRNAAWSRTAGALSPLPGELSQLWALYSLGFMREGYRDMDLLKAATTADLEVFHKMAIKETDDGKVVKPFTTVAMRMIQWWNHCVQADHVNVHIRMFGQNFFWLDKDYTKAPDEIADVAYLNWQRYFALTALRAYPDDNELRRVFNTKKLFSTMTEEMRNAHQNVPDTCC